MPEHALNTYNTAALLKKKSKIVDTEELEILYYLPVSAQTLFSEIKDEFRVFLCQVCDSDDLSKTLQYFSRCRYELVKTSDSANITENILSFQSIMYYATDLMLGFEPWINETTACSFPEPWMKIPEFPEMDFKPEQPDFALTEYQGSFTNPLLGGLTIGKSPSNSKALTFKMSEVTGELLPEGGNVFRLFVDGSYKHLTTPVHGKKPIPFARLFFDFKGKQCIGLKFPDSIFGGAPVNFVKSQGKEEL